MENTSHLSHTSQPDSSGHQIDLEQLLKDGNIIRIHPQGLQYVPTVSAGAR